MKKERKRKIELTKVTIEDYKPHLMRISLPRNIYRVIMGTFYLLYGAIKPLFVSEQFAHPMQIGYIQMNNVKLIMQLFAFGIIFR